jgi:hypothetical protein
MSHWSPEVCQQNEKIGNAGAPLVGAWFVPHVHQTPAIVSAVDKRFFPTFQKNILCPVPVSARLGSLEAAESVKNKSEMASEWYRMGRSEQMKVRCQSPRPVPICRNGYRGVGCKAWSEPERPECARADYSGRSLEPSFSVGFP